MCAKTSLIEQRAVTTDLGGLPPTIAAPWASTVPTKTRSSAVRIITWSGRTWQAG